jgi:branched-chain amino acid transport system permease protein
VTTAQAALSGILVGGLYALMAIGLSLTWGCSR